MTVVINGTSGITDVNGSAAAPAITGTDTDTGVFFGTNTVSLSTGGTERLQIDSSGNAGLGVTPSAWSLGKAIEVGFTGKGIWANNQNEVIYPNNAYFNSGWKYSVSAYAPSQYAQRDGLHAWYTAASGTAGNAISWTQAMTLDASGNLGIGQTSPSGRLDVRTGSAGNYAQFIVGLSGGSSIYYDANTHYFRDGSFTERARIDSSGNLLVGTTSSGNRKFNVLGAPATGTYLATLENTKASSGVYGLQIFYSGATPNNTDNQFLDCIDSAGGGTLRARIYSNGGLANYSANNSNLSDRREKTNFAPAGDYLAKICAIPVQTFNYIDQNLEEDDGLTLGVVAQDVQSVAPELVTETNWGSEEEPKMRLSIYQTDLQYALMKCIQEQQAIITQLQADVAALKAKA